MPAFRLFSRPSMLLKPLGLFALWVLLCLPLIKVDRLIAERGHSWRTAAQELAQTHVGPQALAAPYLLVPYVERWRAPLRDAEGNVQGHQEKQRRAVHVVFAQTQALEGALDVQERYRGIFKVPFFRLNGRIHGVFPPFDAASLPRSQPDSQIEPGRPALALTLGDVRGLEGTPQVRLGEQALTLAAGLPDEAAQSLLASASVHAPLSEPALREWQAGKALAYELKLTLAGQERLAIAPLGAESTARLTSDWPHPSFGGRFLAAERSVSDQGFEASWRISSLVAKTRAQMAAALQKSPPEKEPPVRVARAEMEDAFDSAFSAGAPWWLAQTGLETFDVSLVQPVNAYSMSERAAKYSDFIVALLLLAVFMTELLRRLRLHPVQYALVGLSIAVFFLLLLAMSEKMAFALAYGCASAASVALLAVYFSAVLGGARTGAALAGGVAALYAALYVLLSSEDNALLLGALLVFAMLAALMLATRHVNWWQIGPAAEGENKAESGDEGRPTCENPVPSSGA